VNDEAEDDENFDPMEAGDDVKITDKQF